MYGPNLLRPQTVREENYMPRSENPSGAFSSIVTLASWRLRRTWFLLLITTLGMIAAVVITCAVPLFSTITTTASVRGTLREQPYSSQINCDITPLGLSSHVVRDVQRQLDPIFQQTIGNYLNGPAQLAISSTNIDARSISSLLGDHVLRILSTQMRESASHITLVQGRLPHLTSTPGNDIEVMLTPSTALGLHLHLGSTMKLGFPIYTQFPDPFSSDGNASITRGVSFTIHVVGLFAVNETDISYWHGQNFEPSQMLVDPFQKKIVTFLSMLFPIEGLLGLYDGISAKYHVETPITTTGNTLSWYYSLDPLHVSATQLDDLIKRLASLSSRITIQYANASGAFGANYDPNNPPPYPFVAQANLNSLLLSFPGAPSSLEQARSRITVSGIPTIVLSLQMLALILFFVSLMTDLLVDRQSDAIALLRSRGASRGQIFGALLTQCVGLGLFSLLIGLPLTLGVVFFISQHILPSNAQDAINIITNNPLKATFTISGYALTIVLVVLLTMSLSLARAARMDVLSARREAARSVRRPLWQRLNLDVFAGVLALGGYFVSLYLTSISTALSGTTKALVAVPLSLIAPFFLVLGCLLLFLRFFPALLRVAASLAVKSRSAVSMLALAQMARAPRQAVRMTLLLALATAFALFSLVYTASQEQHVYDVAANQVGADFGGSIATQLQTYQLSPQDEEKQYTAIPGVMAASAGFSTTANVADGKTPLNIDLRAVDTQTFGKTVIWPSDASTQSLGGLLSLLDKNRVNGIRNKVVPVIVDMTTKNALALHLGSAFTVTVNSGAEDNSLLVSDLSCVVVAIVQHIPATVTSAVGVNSPYYTPTGGMLLDYRTYSAVYTEEAQNLVGNGTFLPLNYVWLRTTDNPAQLTRIRVTLTNADTLILYGLNDRRAIIDTLHADPLTITLIGILSIGTVATLLLAIVGDLLASWLSARTRLTNFAVLRALGTSPRQVASVLTWEQALIYIVGVLLGIAFGTLLANTVSPILIANNSSLQASVPTHLVIPFSLLAAFCVVIVIFVLALGMMVRIVSRPSMSQTLRLNED